MPTRIRTKLITLFSLTFFLITGTCATFGSAQDQPPQSLSQSFRAASNVIESHVLWQGSATGLADAKAIHLIKPRPRSTRWTLPIPMIVLKSPDYTTSLSLLPLCHCLHVEQVPAARLLLLKTVVLLT